MDSNSDSDYNYSIKKKSKNKKSKRKKSRHNRSSSSDRDSYDANRKFDSSASSDSDELKRKRLKNKKNSHSRDVIIENKTAKTSNENLEYYGPSLELLLSGVDSNSKPTEYHENKISKGDVKNEHSYNDEKTEASSQENVPAPVSSELVTAIQKELINEIDRKTKDENPLASNEIVTAIQEELIKELDNKADDKNKDTSGIKQEHLNKDVKSISDIEKEHSDTESLRKEERYSKKKTEESDNRSTKISENENAKGLEKREIRKSRSRSLTKSPAFKKTSSKSQYRKRSSISRSSSRESYPKQKRRYSRSSSREKNKKYSSRKRSRSGSYSRSKRGRYSRSYSKSPKRKIRSRSRSRSRHRRRSRSYSRSRTRSPPRYKTRPYFKYRNYGRARGRFRRRSRSRSLSRYRSRSTSRRRSRSRSRQRSRSRSKSSSKTVKDKKSRSKSEEEENKRINQAKVLETARKNVLKMMKDGTLPEGLDVENLKKEHLISIQAGGKSVQELTDFCQRLSQKENDVDDHIADSGKRDDDDTGDEDTGFIHHPFKVKESSTIKLNIRNAVQLPIKTHTQKIAELSSQFPVSSGNQHKQKELEWVPVVPEPAKTETKVATAVSSTTTTVALINQPPPPPSPPPQPPLETPVSYPIPAPLPDVPETTTLAPLQPPPMPPQFMMAQQSVPVPTSIPAQQSLTAPMSMSAPALLPTPYPPKMIRYMTPDMELQDVVQQTPLLPSSNSVFKPRRNIDISTIVAKRFQALTKLKQNENDPEALYTLQQAQQDIQEWVESQQVPGQFTGSTDAKVLSYSELCGPKYYKFKKDFLVNAPPVTGGKGMSLLKKMGWKPGEGLGKNNEGSLVPLVLDIKTDKKGIVALGENSKKGAASSFTKDLQGKHPVSALMELCSKRKWKAPFYTCILDTGPTHKKQYCFKVEVNGVEYQPLNPVSNKKVAKADAAVICLQALNVFTKEAS